ncbi:MAG: NADH-quinone oxidoreductase subunit NuoE [Deltaproteobacteria bacterium]|nr:NADH-quinone oxidoreductase subunit NuoE [Deltaproteobacteria bacterium]
MDEKVEKIIEQHQGKPGTVISVLESVQENYGYLPQQILEQVAQALGVPLAQLFSMATFYSAFSLKPRGKHTIYACLGTACHVRGGARVLKGVSQQIGVKPGDTTDDRQFTLETVRCIGCCSLAPVVKVNEDVYGYTTTDKMRGILDNYKE